MIPTGNAVIYQFQRPDGSETSKYKHDPPTMITPLSTVGKEIKKHLDPDNELKKEAVEARFETMKTTLNTVLYNHLSHIERSETERLEAEKRQLQENLDTATDLLTRKNYPLLYIGSIVSWLTAGERNNIILTYLAYASQTILRNPISVIGLGEGGSGKTHIQEVALGLIPSEFIIHEKSITEAAMFRRAETDPYFYDGRIVNYGDLGGRNSQDFILEAKNLLKELQSDGFLNKPLTVPSVEGGWEVRDLTLHGYPALTYTTVPNFDFDDQEKSRSIFITPRMDNKLCFNNMKTVLELKFGGTYQQYRHYQNEADKIQYMTYQLRERMNDLNIINPYSESVIKFLSESEYFKRDFDKFNGIMKTITSFNCYNRETYKLDGEEVLFTSLQDIQLFISILRRYHESINENITPKAAEILNDIRANIDDWDEKLGTENDEHYEGSFTITEYADLTSFNLTKRSYRRYFGELNDAGFLKVVDTSGRANVYELTGKVSGDKIDEILTLSDYQKNLIRHEMGLPVLEYILEDTVLEGLDISRNDVEVDVPGWNDFDV